MKIKVFKFYFTKNFEITINFLSLQSQIEREGSEVEQIE